MSLCSLVAQTKIATSSDTISFVKFSPDAKIILMGKERGFVVKFGKALVSIRADSEELLCPLSEYLKEHIVESKTFDAEIDLGLKKIFSPIPTHSRLVLRYFAVKIFYLRGTMYFTDFRSYLTLYPDGKKAIGFISPETLEESGTHFFTHTFFTFALFEILRHHGVYFIHSAGLISPEGTCYLFPAEGGQGKSTLSLYLIRQGYQYLSDDVIFLEGDSKDLRVLGFRKLSHLSEELLPRFAELKALRNARNLDGKGKKIVDLDLVYPGKRVEQMSGKFIIIFPKRVSESASRLKALSALEGFHLLVSQSPFAFINPCLAHRHFQIIRDLLSRSRVWSMESSSDWIERPELLNELLSEASSVVQSQSFAEGRCDLERGTG